MASNDELIKKIQEIAETNGVDVPETEGKSNADLAKILSGLKAEELIKSIQEAAKAKEVDVPETDGLTNKELAKILSGLEADTETPDAAAKDAAKAKDEASAKAEKAAKAAVKAKKKPPFTIAEGKSITCLKGSIDAGEEVKAEYLPDGRKTLNSLIERGLVVKN